MKQNEKVRVVYVPIDQLKPAEYNPRKSSPAEERQLKESIARFGFVDPVICNSNTQRNNIIIGGHFRVRVAKEMGIRIVPVVYIDIPEVEKEKELNIRLNRNTGTWDIEMLSKYSQEMLLDCGFTDIEMDKILTDTGVASIDDEVPSLPETPRTKLGDIYTLVNHRLLCGDSTSDSDVGLLMDGKKADLLFTDPPYGVSIEKKNDMLNSKGLGARRGRVLNDSLPTADLRALLTTAFKNVNGVLKDSASFYVTAPQGGELWMMMMMMMIDSGLPVRHILIWKKSSPSFSLGRLDYDYQHEPILYGWKKTHEFYGGGEFKSSVWDIQKPSASKLHPTMKPVQLVVNAVLNSTKREDIVLDPFCGSGTTVIACERTGRTCYAMELDPHYCDVIVERWEKESGRKAEKTKGA